MTMKIILKVSYFAILVLSSASVLPNISDEADLYPLAIIHINDFHARFVETNTASSSCKDGDDCIGGYARVVTAVNQLYEKHKDKNTIFLNAGDSFQGTLWYTVLRWNVTSHFLNKLPADAMTLGNHEFDHGIEGLLPFLDSIQTPMVVANLDISEEPRLKGRYQNSIVLERSGRKIGIIGVITHETPQLSNSEKLKFLDEIKIVKEESKLMHDQGIDIIIVLSHCGINVDKVIAKEGGPYIDIIVGGHSHTFLYNGTKPGNDSPQGKYPTIVEQNDGRAVYIVQASAYAKYVGDFVVWFDDKGEIQKHMGNPVYLNKEIIEDWHRNPGFQRKLGFRLSKFIIKELVFVENQVFDANLNVALDPDTVKELAPWKELIDEFACTIHGETRVKLNKSPCSKKECNMGNLITDAFKHSFIKKDFRNEWAFKAIALIQTGGIRTSIEIGEITYGDLAMVMPFENQLVTFEIRGDKLLAALEHSVANQKHMLQVSGLKVVYNLKNPVGERVISVKTMCQTCSVPSYQPLDPFEYYHIITVSFAADGGDGFTWFRDFAKNKRAGELDIDAFTSYVELMSPIYTTTEGRITVT